MAVRIKGMNPAISVVVSVYKKPQVLEWVLTSLKHQTFTDFDIIIADDGSDKEVFSVIKRIKISLPVPVTHVWHENAGFRKTVIVNKAVARSSAEYLVFVDGDCILHHRFLEMHNRYRRAGRVLSGRRVNLNRELCAAMITEDIITKRIESFTFWIKHTDSKSKRHGFIIPGSFFFDNLFRKHYSVLGCNMSMYRNDFFQVNGYDETIIGRGMEDHNLANRMKMFGLRLMCVTRKALQYHVAHTADPVPHSSEKIQKYLNPDTFRAADGISKYMQNSVFFLNS